jgi:phosphonate transport system substrate-binding protein
MKTTSNMKSSGQKIIGTIFVVAVVLLVVVWVLTTTVAKDFSMFEGSDMVHEGDPTPKPALVIGSVAADSDAERAVFEPFAEYLADQLLRNTNRPGEVVVAESTAEMAQMLRTGRVDFYFDSPFPAYVVSELAQSRPLVVRWKKGVETYKSAIFTKRNSGVMSLEDLRGEVVAFEHPDSTSAYLLPKSILLKQGLQLARKAGAEDVVQDESVGYYFTGDDKAVVQDVLSGTAVAGAQNLDEIEEFSQESEDDLRILATSPEVYRHIGVVSREVPGGLRTRLREVLFAMDESPEGRRVLRDFENTTKFTPIPDDAYEHVRSLSDLVELEIIQSQRL